MLPPALDRIRVIPFLSNFRTSVEFLSFLLSGMACPLVIRDPD